MHAKVARVLGGQQDFAQLLQKCQLALPDGNADFAAQSRGSITPDMHPPGTTISPGPISLHTHMCVYIYTHPSIYTYMGPL